MGKNIRPGLCQYIHGELEKEALAKCQRQPACYPRYLDDVWGICTGTEEEFADFVATLNSHDPSNGL